MSTPMISLDGHGLLDTHDADAVEGPNFTSAGHRPVDTQAAGASGGETNPVPADQRPADAQSGPVGGDGTNPTDSLDGQPDRDTHMPTAVEGTNPVPADQTSSGAQYGFVGGDGPSSDDGQSRHATQRSTAVVAPTPEQAIQVAVSKAASPARAPLPPAPARVWSTPIDTPPVLADPLLALAADVLDDLERVRIANENRLRQLTRDEEDTDGEERGFGLTLDHPDVKRLAALVDALAKAEHDAELNLKRQLRAHPLGPWVKQARGVGEKQAARLLAAVGDPYWNELHNRPRTVSELWAYAGYHVLPAGQDRIDAQVRSASGAQAGSHSDHGTPGAQALRVGVAATRARGQRANWSADAKMRAHLVAVSIVKAGGPYREVYDEGRIKYADAIHQTECKRCGPAGKPALVGSPISAGHQHARALRLVAKAVLKDLWREAKRLHEEASA